jgi:nitrogen fixation protein NifQ
MLNRFSLALTCPASAHESINGVLDSAEGGYLPLFAATLGMRYDVFSAILSGDQIDPVLQTPLHADLLAEWVPELFPPLVEMLWDSRSNDEPLTWWVAHAIACACFGHRHLWQDLGFGGRNEVSGLLAKRFCWLFTRNTGNMKWKRFIFQELGLHLGVPELLPPGCSDCEDFRSCFGKARISDSTLSGYEQMAETHIVIHSAQ